MNSVVTKRRRPGSPTAAQTLKMTQAQTIARATIIRGASPWSRLSWSPPRRLLSS